LKQLHDHGQSPWVDYITRNFYKSGELQQLVDSGVWGLTANPTIFEKAIAGSTDYDEAVRELVCGGADAPKIYDELVVEDIRQAADIMKPIYEQTNGQDGYVSIEVSPALAHDTEGTIEEARKYWQTIDRPNILIKVPATDEGIPAIRQLLSEGISVNVTLLFSVEYYERVMDAYIEALEDRVTRGEPVDRLASVASFFVSRVDSEIDKRLGKLIEAEEDETRRKELEGLLGKAAVANARMAYARFQEQFGGERFEALKAKGAHVQRPLWASTGTKNPAYSDVLYVEELIGPDTVNTMPMATIRAFEDHGKVARTVDADVEGAATTLERLEAAGISLTEVTDKLLVDGVKLFADSFEGLDRIIREKREVILADVEDRQSAKLGDLQPAVTERLQAWQERELGRKLWERAASIWSEDPQVREKIANRLGWLPVIEEMAAKVPELESFGNAIKDEGYTHAVLLGMGGSSLAPEVLRATFGSKPGYPRLAVLDTTDSATIAVVESELDLAKTLFIVSSKSGTTIEPNALLAYFWEKAQGALGEDAGRNFIAITDPDTKLAEEARARGFRRVWENRADIGGRYSALSYFGLVPAALIGVTLPALLDSARQMAAACAADAPATENPGLMLGAILGEAAKAGRDKLTLVPSPNIKEFGIWAEQLIAESTGKEGRGILPVAGEGLGEPAAYGDDRLFVHLSLSAPEDVKVEEKLAKLAEAGHPVVTLKLIGPTDMGGEFLRWELATAAAGLVLGINPFDEPNVQESKDNTARLLKQWEEQGSLPEGEPTVAEGELSLYGVEGGAPTEALARFFEQVGAGDYVAFMAYFRGTDEVDNALYDVRIQVRDGLRVATTLGYGPRFLHSTGQLHKGGAANGVFVQLTADDPEDLDIPGWPYGFNVLKRAQALGDYQALESRGRKLMRVHINGDVVAGLLTLRQLAEEAVSVRS
jgi:transaldolase/glucose-6-phosphate isomerase